MELPKLENVNEMVDRALAEAYRTMERAQKEINAYHEAGKEIIQVTCNKGTKRGDIIEVQANPDEHTPESDESPEEAAEEETKHARVIAVRSMTGIDTLTMEMHAVCDAICVVLKPGDITTEEDFAGLYGDESREAADALFEASSEELGEAAVAQAQEEAPDPNVCSCGANREMCERNQNVFGGHLQ